MSELSLSHTASLSRIRLIPDIAARAHLLKLKREGSLYFILRAINVEVYHGYGKLQYDDCFNICRRQFNIRRWTFDRTLQAGDGKFWNVEYYKKVNQATGEINTRATIKIYGVERVCKALGITRLLDTHFREIHADEFDTLKRRNTHLWRSTLKPGSSYKADGIKARPRSRVSIEAQTGVSPRQQRRYCSSVYTGLQAVRRVKNVTTCPVNGHTTLPATHYSRQLPGRRGILARINRLLKTSFKSDEAIERRYYDTARGYARDHHKPETAFIKVVWAKRHSPWVVEYRPELCLV